jgi:hypothetical protein
MRIDLLAEQPGIALAGGQQPGQHLHGGRFAAAVGAQKAEDLAATDAEIHMVHGHKVAKAHGEIARLDGDVVIAGLQRRDHHGGMAALFPRAAGR